MKRVNELSGGESSASNVELIKNNATLGAQIAVQLSLLPTQKTIEECLNPQKKVLMENDDEDDEALNMAIRKAELP